MEGGMPSALLVHERLRIGDWRPSIQALTAASSSAGRNSPGAMAGHASADVGLALAVEGGEERGGSAPLGLSGPHRAERLGSSWRLNLLFPWTLKRPTGSLF